jgi:hypothetical protein
MIRPISISFEFVDSAYMSTPTRATKRAKYIVNGVTLSERGKGCTANAVCHDAALLVVKADKMGAVTASLGFHDTAR